MLRAGAGLDSGERMGTRLSFLFRKDRTRKLATGIAALVLIALLGWMSWSEGEAEHARSEASLRAAHTVNVLLATDAVLRAMQNAETGQRGFLLTRDPGFLEPFNAGRAALSGALERLHDLTDADPAQKAHAALIEQLATTRLGQIERGIQSPPGPSSSPALVQFMRGGKRTMDDLRAELARIEAGERGALAQRQALAKQAEAHATRWRGLITFFALALCALCGLAFLGMFRAWRESRQHRLLAASHLVLAKGRHLLQSIIDASGDAIFIKDRTGHVLFANARLQELVGKPVAELHGIPLPPARDVHEAELLAEADHAVLEHGVRGSVELHLEAGGQMRVFQADKIPWMRGGVTKGVIGIVRDITEIRTREAELEHRVEARTRQLESALKSVQREMAEREAAEEAIRQMQKIESLGHMTGGIAHDFNNMLSVITNSLDTARKRLPIDPASIAPLLESALAGAERASTLTARLLAFARQQTLEPVLVEVNGQVGRTAELLERTLDSTIELQLDLDPEAGWTEVDQGQLESALVNLSVNARDAMPQGGRLTISTRRFGEEVEIAVTDTGTGMSPEALTHAFEPFFTTKEVGKGTGLGLSQVHGFVMQSGGRIALDSRPDCGTTVRLYLPARPQPASERPCDIQHHPREGHGETVLLVEDEALVRVSAQASLEALGYNVTAVASGHEALAALKRDQTIALLITDIAMPGMNGRDLAEAARQLRPEIAVLLTTGYEPHRPDGSNPVPVLIKPYMLDELASAIDSALR